MNHFQTTNRNSPVIDFKPPRVTRSSLDTRNTNPQLINNGNSSIHRQTSFIKSPSLSPTVSNRNNLNNNNNNNELNQSSHRVYRRTPKESNYLPQKRTDSSLSFTNSNKQTNSFLDSGSESDDNNKNTNKNNNNFNRKNKNNVNNSFLNNENDNSSIIAKCIFSVDGKSADVEIDKNRISWKYISSSLDEISNTRRPGSSSKKNNTQINNSQLFQIPYERIFSIEPKRIKNSPTPMNFEHRFSLSDDFSIEGFIIHVFDRSKPNIYIQRSITFSHPHRQTCKQWLNYLYNLAGSFLVEKRLIILLNPYSGEKKTRSILNFLVHPLLALVNFNIETIEFHDKLPLRDSLYNEKINFNNYYGIVLLCGDGCVSNTIRDIVETIARNEDDSNEFIDLNKVKIKTPICIVPAGTTNVIANSIYGTSNPITPLMHLLTGTYINIDITSIYTSDHKFFNFGFGYACGFGSDLIRYFERYSRFGIKKLQAALARGAAKKKHKPIEIEIKYIASSSNQPCDKIRCFRGCNLCDIQEKNHHNGKTLDEVQEFDPLAVSINEIEDNLGNTYRRNSIDDHSENWRTVSGSFIHMELLANAMLWDVTAGGLSKYGHLADGFMDLILVDAVSRKEFYRFLKRHTKIKNQLDFPFVKAIRIKEAKIKIKNQFVVENVGPALTQSISYNEGRNSRTMNHFNSPKKSNNVNYDLSDSNTDNEIEDFINNNFGSTNADNDFEDDNDNNNYINRNRIGSSRLDRSISGSINNNEKKRGPLLYYIKQNNENENLNNDDKQNQNSVEQSDLPTKSKSHKRSSSLVRNSQLLLQKSKSILNLFQSDDKKNRSSSSATNSSTIRNDDNNSPFKHHSAKISSKNDKLQKSNKFKSPFSWNIDFNLYPMPYLHIKCHKQYLPVFGCGIDDDTEIDDTSIKGCFP